MQGKSLWAIKCIWMTLIALSVYTGALYFLTAAMLVFITWDGAYWDVAEWTPFVRLLFGCGFLFLVYVAVLTYQDWLAKFSAERVEL